MVIPEALTVTGVPNGANMTKLDAAVPVALSK